MCALQLGSRSCSGSRRQRFDRATGNLLHREMISALASMPTYSVRDADIDARSRVASRPPSFSSSRGWGDGTEFDTAVCETDFCLPLVRCGSGIGLHDHVLQIMLLLQRQRLARVEVLIGRIRGKRRDRDENKVRSLQSSRGGPRWIRRHGNSPSSTFASGGSERGCLRLTEGERKLHTQTR